MPDHFDDSDMKIVGAPQKKTDDVDFQGFLAESSRQHFNGNIAKAKTLGANIVSSFSYSAAPEELVELIRQSGVEPTDEVLRQARFLSVFSAEISLERFLPSPLLAEIAKSAMYDVLMQFSPDFYDELARSGAFSFYYMSAAKGKVTDARVGKQFAVLCGSEGDAALSALGRTLHAANMAVYKKAIRGFVFV